MILDSTFDFRSDVKLGQDPDKYSKALRAYHKFIWSKPLPNGSSFKLDDKVSRTYLHHNSNQGSLSLSSDQIFTSFATSVRMKSIIELLPDGRIERISDQLHTIGGFILFPSKQINRKPTINAARGMNARIRDRFDITLECIRRHYLGLDSPLTEDLNRYSSFFSLFVDFRGYVDFFRLNDLVSENLSAINFFMPFDSAFPANPVPKSVAEYNGYIDNMVRFVTSRTIRICDP